MFYEPAAQAHLTSNAVYKRYVAAKVSASSNTTGTVTIQLYDVTTSAQLATTTITIASINTETMGASTNVTQQVTNLGDVLTIRVKHSVNGATVTLNSGGIMEADKIVDCSTNTQNTINASINTGCFVSSFKYYVLAGLSTAAITIQPQAYSLLSPHNSLL